jgi:gamma-glutamyltranspeptidase/glutathione hydrolase
LPAPRLLSPAIAYARNGYPVVERISATIATVEALFRDHWPTSAAVYLPGGRIPEPESILRQSDARRYVLSHPQ